MKLAALLSLPGAPVNFGHVGHSHSGRERFAFGLPSIAVRPEWCLPLLDPRLQRRETVDLRVERADLASFLELARQAGGTDTDFSSFDDQLSRAAGLAARARRCRLTT